MVPPAKCPKVGFKMAEDKFIPKETKPTDAQWEQIITNSQQLENEKINPIKYCKHIITRNYNQIRHTLDYYTGLAAKKIGLAYKRHWNWWDKIYTTNNGASLYLGAIPLQKSFFRIKYRDDLLALQKEGIGAVLSVVEVFENRYNGLITATIRPEQWRKAGLKQLQLPTPDFATIPMATIHQGVEFIAWNLQHGRSVYVHCKAGRGRSALMAMCYLIKYHALSAAQAFIAIKSQRKQAGFNQKDAKTITLLQFENLCNSPYRII